MERKRLFIFLTIISIVMLGIGGTFAYYTTSAVATNITQIKSGNLTMTIDGGGDTDTSFMPSKCTSEYAIKKKIVATSNNTSGGKVSFSIGMNIATLSDSLKTSTMKFALTTSSDSCTSGLIANGNFSNATVGSDIWIVKNDYDNITNTSNTYTKTYYLYIWLDEKETQNLSGSISVKLKGTSSNNPDLTTEAVKTIPLYDYIKNNADTTTTIDFSKTSAQDSTNGIYTTTNTDSGKPVYYYRGNVDNRLIFANFCWRIVRTTETGGVKLIYDGVPSNGQCSNTGDNSTIGSSKFNEKYNNAKYVGYMYGSSIDDTANTDDSTIKAKIDEWYKNNMTSYTSQLEDTVFCNDRSYTKDGSDLYFGAFTRLYTNKTPTLKCQNARDKFTTKAINGNGALTYPVGLITADEMAYAGGRYYSSSSDANRSFYLYTGSYFWALSPSDFVGSGAGEFTLGSDGILYYYNVITSNGVRPSVSLQPGIAMTGGGSGTAADPFVIG
mgnify:CR=1 FL=1